MLLSLLPHLNVCASCVPQSAQGGSSGVQSAVASEDKADSDEEVCALAVARGTPEERSIRATVRAGHREFAPPPQGGVPDAMRDAEINFNDAAAAQVNALVPASPCDSVACAEGRSTEQLLTLCSCGAQEKPSKQRPAKKSKRNANEDVSMSDRSVDSFNITDPPSEWSTHNLGRFFCEPETRDRAPELSSILEVIPTEGNRRLRCAFVHPTSGEIVEVTVSGTSMWQVPAYRPAVAKVLGIALPAPRAMQVDSVEP